MKITKETETVQKSQPRFKFIEGVQDLKKYGIPERDQSISYVVFSCIFFVAKFCFFPSTYITIVVFLSDGFLTL